jgi:hypothetical protein
MAIGYRPFAHQPSGMSHQPFATGQIFYFLFTVSVQFNITLIGLDTWSGTRLSRNRLPSGITS